VSTPRLGQLRWPLHPRPGPVEALSSWLQRLARLYGLSVTDLLRHNLGAESAQVTDSVLADLDFDPPALMLAALAQRTGVELAELQTMTIAGWVPWLTDTVIALDSDVDQELFDTYVRQYSVLLASGETGRNTVHRCWRGPWLVTTHPRSERRVCPVCVADPECGTALIWRVPITLSCMEHTCRLEPAVDVELAALEGTPMAPAPVGEHVAALDRRTHEGLTTGRVTLPGRSVHVGIWFRLLRTLLDELSIAPSRVGVRSRAALHRIWRVTGRPERAGLTVWRPFEQLDWPHQETMLEAAAVACHLVETGMITARGTLGPALAIEPHQPVHDGDQPAHEGWDYHWKRAREAFTAAIDLARVDPGTARHLLTLLTRDCLTPACFAREHQCLLATGIPERFLAVTDERYRADLLVDRA
jgi:hypothetical protein